MKRSIMVVVLVLLVAGVGWGGDWIDIEVVKIGAWGLEGEVWTPYLNGAPLREADFFRVVGDSLSLENVLQRDRRCSTAAWAGGAATAIGILSLIAFEVWVSPESDLYWNPWLFVPLLGGSVGLAVGGGFTLGISILLPLTTNMRPVSYARRLADSFNASEKQ
jgi:hypothetical protein